MKWSLLEIALALGAAAALARMPQLADDDPFRSTLLTLPLVIVALRAIDRRARHLGATHGAASRLLGRLEGAFLTLLVLLTLGRDTLGLVVTELYLAVGYILLLTHRAIRTVVALRPCLGRRLPDRPPGIFFLFPLVIYLALLPWSGEHRQVDGDEPYYLLITHSLTHDLDVDLADNYQSEDWRHFMDRPIEPQPGDPVGEAGEIYSRHNALLPVVLAPAYAVGGRWGAQCLMTVLTAALGWSFLRCARHTLPEHPGAALLAYGIFVLSPPLLLYSYQIWIEIPAALALTLALDRLWVHRPRAGATPQPWTPRDAALFALPVLLMPILKLRLGLLSLPLVALAAWHARRGRDRRVALAALAALAVVSAGLLALNQLRFGNPLKIHSWNELGLLGRPLADFLRGAVGMFYDVAFGLFPCAPIWMLLLPALWRLLRRHGPLATDGAAIGLPYLMAVAPRIEWYGGWSPPFRYPLVLLPLFALALGELFARRHRAGLRMFVAPLVILTVLLTLVWIIFPGWTYNFADGQTYLLNRIAERFDTDVARFFPSAVRPRTATWLWPLVSFLLIPLVSWRGNRRLYRDAGLWGVCGLLLLAASVPHLLLRWPTRTVELEDAFVVKEGGHLHPDRWITQRPAYRGGWTLVEGSRLTAPVITGGDSVTLRLAVRFIANRPAPFKLEIAAADTPLVRWQAERPDVWQVIELGPFPWPEGAPLVLAHDGKARPGGNAVIVDRVDFEWH